MAKRKTAEDDLVVVSSGSGAVSFETEGQSACGKFLRQEKGVGKNESNLYHFEDDKGVEFALWGSAQLDPLLSVAKKGEKIRVTYQGKKKTSNGYKVKTFQIAGPAAFAERAQKVILARMAESAKKRPKKKSPKK
jgi:hypothetical protein